MSTVVPMAPKRLLDEAVKLFEVTHHQEGVLWRRRLHKMWSQFDRDYVVELTNRLVLRMRDVKTGEIVVESKPGQLRSVDYDATVR